MQRKGRDCKGKQMENSANDTMRHQKNVPGREKFLAPDKMKVDKKRLLVKNDKNSALFFRMKLLNTFTKC